MTRSPQLLRARLNPNTGLRESRSAGGIVYRRRQGMLEILFIRDPFNRWTFPKGSPENNESLLQAAMRETREETGLTRIRPIAPVGKTKFRFRREGELIEKSVYFFLFVAPAFEKTTFTGDGAIWEGRWFPANRALDASSYRNLDRLLMRALQLIAQEERRKRLRVRW